MESSIEWEMSVGDAFLQFADDAILLQSLRYLATREKRILTARPASLWACFCHLLDWAYMYLAVALLCFRYMYM